MNDKRYRWILQTIVTTVILTIVVQVYWNYKNYLLNTQNFKNSVQISLDNALENYYADLAKTSDMQLIDLVSDSIYNIGNRRFMLQNERRNFNSDSIYFERKFHNKLNSISRFKQSYDSINHSYTLSTSNNKTPAIKIIAQKKLDSIKLLKGITSIYISIQSDTLDFSRLEPLIIQEFKRKNFTMPFTLSYFKNDSLLSKSSEHSMNRNYLTTSSKTAFLHDNERLELAYPNATIIILKQGYLGILLSSILSITIIASLFYLLKIIKHQKQLAEIKNDLIGNITHEFKTPITTIGVALESIKNFNAIDNKKKTKSYLDISNTQLSKLTVMVEKLLETATLDSNNLQLNKEEVNITHLLQILIDKHKIQTNEKIFNFSAKPTNILAKVDIFHFENALNNILDNALKYGGKNITIDLKQSTNSFTIDISDNGTTLTKDNKDKIFEKFYRVPKGNTHDIKGFGIGLYYVKKIIEKHGGTIELELQNTLTSFKIILPNE